MKLTALIHFRIDTARGGGEESITLCILVASETSNMCNLYDGAEGTHCFYNNLGPYLLPDLEHQSIQCSQNMTDDDGNLHFSLCYIHRE
jgi:hypothetical protein